MSSQKTSPQALPMPATYELAVQELEQWVLSLESGQLPLDELLEGYQRGAALLDFCKGKLQALQSQIQVIDGANFKPWGPT